MVGILLSFWEGLFSGDMLVLGLVNGFYAPELVVETYGNNESGSDVRGIQKFT